MNILELKRATAGNVFRISEGEDQNGWYDNMQPLPSSLINSTTPKFTEAGKPKQVQVQVGQTEQGEPIWETQNAPAPLVTAMQDSYDNRTDYNRDMETLLNDRSGVYTGNAEDRLAEDSYYTYGAPEQFNAQQATELYNSRDPRLMSDRYASSMINGARNDDSEAGLFNEDGSITSAENLDDYIQREKARQARRAAEFQTAGLLLVGGIAGGAVLAGGAAGGGAAGGAAAAGGAGSGLTSAQLAAASAEAVASGGAAGGAAAGTAAGSGMGLAASGGSSASFLSSPMGKFAVGQGISLGAKALSGAGKDREQNPGLMNSSQNRPAQQPIVNNYYSGQQQRPAPEPASAPRPIAGANGSMYGSGSGFGTSINKYAQKKSASGG